MLNSRISNSSRERKVKMITITVSGPMKSGKSTILAKIVAALKVHGLNTDMDFAFVEKHTRSPRKSKVIE